ncbi:hypothetical protein X474_02890 [Dethiosulfatarculus sandiegensis]|uniref:Uncharacterized protein n=1 Tax=Dethiosulfatarculus sandiegensis TaxID=1429043 RepID=A0A0D2K238_9BACT|nr:hypothetical protein X474_02890 [Dethiosulfatarculus sandiegensis]
MLARFCFLVCFLSFCLIFQPPCALSADPTPPSGQEESGEDIGTVPLVPPEEFENTKNA